MQPPGALQPAVETLGGSTYCTLACQYVDIHDISCCQPERQTSAVMKRTRGIQSQLPSVNAMARAEF